MLDPRRSLLLLSTFLAAGCAHVGPASRQETGLEARILSDTVRDGWLVFHLSRPAHVAVFDVVPGSGVRVLRPWSAGRGARLSRAGTHSVDMKAFTRGRRTRRVWPGAAYAYVVACESSLDLEALSDRAAFAFSVRPVRPGPHDRGSPFRVMDRVLSTVAPTGDHGCSVDQLAYWIGPRGR